MKKVYKYKLNTDGSTPWENTRGWKNLHTCKRRHLSLGIFSKDCDFLQANHENNKHLGLGLLLMFLKRPKGSVGQEEAAGVSLSSHFKWNLPLKRQLRERTVPPIFNSAERKYPPHHNTTICSALAQILSRRRERKSTHKEINIPKTPNNPNIELLISHSTRPNSTHTLQNRIRTWTMRKKDQEKERKRV